MPRPKKRRRVCAMPVVRRFGSPESKSCRTFTMTVDEYEAIRLIDLLGYTQSQCAQQMGVARTTVQAVYDQARRKLAQALVQGDPLVITGGEYWVCPHRGEGCCKGPCRRCFPEQPEEQGKDVTK